MNRIDYVMNIMKRYRNTKYEYLGEGWEAVVVHDGLYVYKVFVPKVGDPTKIESWKFAFLKSKAGKFKNRLHLIDYEFIKLPDGINAIRYPFNKFEKVKSISEEESISFLIECWQEQVVFRDIKLSNFIRINGKLVYVDYGFNGDFINYSDNYFQNMAVRIFIDIKYPFMSEEEKSILKRSTINNFNIPELEEFHEFLNKVFSNIIFEESKKSIMAFNTKNEEETFLVKSNKEVVELIKNNIINKDEINITIKNFKSLNLEFVFWNLLKFGIRLDHVKPNNLKLNKQGFHEPESYTIYAKKLQDLPYKITLLIKACPQESNTLYQQVKHILKQMLSPNTFYEKVIAIDKKENDFLRQYSGGNLEELYSVIEKLIDEGLIDYYIELPDDEIENVNYRWFGLKTKETHSIKNIPVAPQLYAFEVVKGDYILQMDSDVMIGRADYHHSFLSDMIKALEENKNATSVGFNIPKNKDITFVKYHAPKGEYKPEVRFALIHKRRFLDSRPWPNELINGKLQLSWYQSLHLHQKKTNYVSLRGGDPKSYYIHPQNYRKACKDGWFTILDRIEKNIIPDIQREHFDTEGSYYDWTIPKRNEQFVIVTLLRNVEYSRFLRTWNSITSQKHENFGWIIIDDASDNGIHILIESLIKESPLKNRITFVKNRFQKGIAANTYKAIHYFIDNPETVVVIVDGDDALIGNNVLRKLKSKYFDYGCDVVIGKMYRTDKLWAHYPYMPNFYNPRLYGGNVWQHLRSFKKYLFDSINLYDLRYEKKSGDFVSGNIGSKWFEHCIDYAYMVPIVEMAENPSFIETYNYYHERTTPNTKDIRELKDKIIKNILSRKPYTKKDLIKNGRKDFIPNLNKIEIDITYDCNLKCISCNRSCTQAPSKEDSISIKQIHKFIEESIEISKKWELINILGGEPTLHPNFLEIVELILNEYILKYSPDTILQITSNGYTEDTKKILNKLPKSKNIIIDKKSFKESNKVIYFTPFNLAPVDLDDFKNKEFSKGCWITSYCGIGLNKYGYYPCSVAAAMDRVMGYDVGIKSLKEASVDKLKELLNLFCGYCGNFVEYHKNYGNFIPRCEKSPFIKNIISKTWKDIYSKYHKKRPNLTPIYE